MNIDEYRKPIAELSVQEYDALEVALIEELDKIMKANGSDQASNLVAEIDGNSKKAAVLLKSVQMYQKQLSALSLCYQNSAFLEQIETIKAFRDADLKNIGLLDSATKIAKKEIAHINGKIQSEIIQWTIFNRLINTEWFEVDENLSRDTQFVIGVFAENFHFNHVREAYRTEKPYNKEALAHYLSKIKIGDRGE